MFKVFLFISLGLIALVIINKLVSFFIKDSSIRYILYLLLIFLFIFLHLYTEKKTFKIIKEYMNLLDLMEKR